MPDLPFEEHETVARARATAHRLAGSALPIYVTGEPGTGRRTLARQLAEARSNGGGLLELHAGAPVPTPLTDRVVLVHHLELLERASQVRLAEACASGARVVAWGAPGGIDGAHPEVRAHVGNGVIELPPLRERGADSIAWARLFVARHAPGGARLGPDAERAIAVHAWPGNITQLEGAIVRALAVAGDPTRELTVEDLGVDGAVTDGDLVPLSEAVERFRREYILKAVERCGGNRTHAAKALQVDPRTVFRYLEGAKRDEA